MRRLALPAVVVMLVGAAGWFAMHGWGDAASRTGHVERKLALIQQGIAEAQRDCGDLSSTRIFLVLGQSNAANHGDPRGASEHGAVWWEGQCFALADPVPGGTGSGGSVWPRFADAWFARTGERSLFVVLGVDATSVGEWAGNAHLVGSLAGLMAEMERHRLQPDAVFWQQGEADARRGTTASVYAERLAVVIERLRAAGVSSPVFLARSTRCRSDAFEPVRLAISRLVDSHVDILAGPDTDQVALEARHDGCHFGAEGLDQAALAWVESVAASGVLRPFASR